MIQLCQKGVNELEMTFLERFKELINENGYTLSEVAQKANLPRSTVSSYINRKSVPSAIQLEAIANLFDCSVDYLLGRSDDFGNVVATTSNLTERESRLLKAFGTLSALEQDKLIADAEFYSMRNRSKFEPIKK